MERVRILENKVIIYLKFITYFNYPAKRAAKSLLFMALKIGYFRPKMSICAIFTGISIILYAKIST